MFIKSMVLDGFKSYGNRIEINGFDPEFNAITGLNGTGKSNILDSICFVLGITNLSNVRVSSLQELIFKQGQAGINKATVSITFDNRNKNNSPIGYENHNEIIVTRQVVLGGKNKYLINGINVQNKRVSDMFCSVQLNVNNPHFLIMQGRITKVLNMRPFEILSMVEEAAGTRMYEAKKQAAEKTIEKKDAKLKELNEVIRDEMAPKLQRLQDERSQYQEYQKVVRELENLNRLWIAWKYVKEEESVVEVNAKISEVTNEINSKKDVIQNKKEESEKLKKQVAELNEKLDKESGGILNDLNTELAELAAADVNAATKLKEAINALAERQKEVRIAKRARAAEDTGLDGKRATLECETASFAALREKHEGARARLAEAQRQFHEVSEGREADDGQALQDQLIAAQSRVKQASTRITQNKRVKQDCDEKLKALEKHASYNSGQLRQDQDSIQRLDAEVETLTRELSELRERSQRYAALRAGECGRQTKASVLRQKADRLASVLQGRHGCDVVYSDPEPGFDRGRVLGPVCTLVTVAQSEYCTALETAAGGKLYNVVVDTERTSRLLLQRGQLQHRTTFAPLDKINPQRMDPAIVQLAQQVGGGSDKVHLALDLLTFPERVRPVAQWVFGQTFVCADKNAAAQIAFHPRIRRRCVTIDGQAYDPQGLLTGGSNAKGGSTLLMLQELQAAKQELEEVMRHLQDCTEEMEQLQCSMKSHKRVEERYNTAVNCLEVTRARVANSAHAQVHADAEELRTQREEVVKRLEEDEQELKEAAALEGQLKHTMQDVDGHRQREYKKREEEVKQAKNEALKYDSEWIPRNKKFEALQAEVLELERSAAASQLHLDELEAALPGLEGARDRAEEERATAKDEMKRQQAKVEAQRALEAGRSQEMAQLVQRQEALVQNCVRLEQAVKELSFRLDELVAVVAKHRDKMAKLVKENTWIQSEHEYFGRAGGLYDFEAREAAVADQRRAQLIDRRDKLAHGLNTRAHTLLGREEEQYQDVMNKKRIVEADRAKLVQVMAELDEKKKRTVVTACEQVNKDFGSIFSTLLPGAQARLRPPAGQTALDGLEVNVGFNGVWKKALTELSGGQRSLVALSLVLAMLRFKPAPLYILDEVDAALDLSHTQNIGRMLKIHFKNSQFIIVSLKDGMFNNANVLFRTCFVEGMSSIKRTVGSSQHR